MHVAVELGFETPFREHVKRLWLSLRDIYGPMEGPDATGEPHISLTSFPDQAPSFLEAELKDLAERFPPFELDLSTVAHFPNSEGVVYLAPRPSKELSAVHSAFHEAIAVHGEKGHPYYRPDNWMPHCTLAMGVPDELVLSVIERCQASLFNNGVGVETVAGVEYRPARELYRFKFSGYEAA